MSDAFSQFHSQMQESEDYLKMEGLKNGYGYKIFASNAYVGIWIESTKGFLISRYKVGPNPLLRIEYHWDTWTPDNPTGTVKPLECIEKCPFELREECRDHDYVGKDLITEYLDKLEENNPVVKGYNSLQDRKMAAIKFGKRLSGEGVDRNKKKIHEMPEFFPK
jgi:hypothetical protein